MKCMKGVTVMLVGLMLLLLGCGTNEQVAEQANGNEKSALENSKQDEEIVADKEEQEGVIRILEQLITYNLKGESKQDTAFLKYNDNQDYSIYVLPQYELTAEEPNKDVLFLSEDDRVFMRIELLPENVDVTSITETTKAQLGVVNSDVKLVTPPMEGFYKDAVIMEASKAGEIVTAYIVNQPDLNLKVTIFTKDDKDHREAFTQMAKTIMKN